MDATVLCQSGEEGKDGPWRPGRRGEGENSPRKEERQENYVNGRKRKDVMKEEERIEKRKAMKEGTGRMERLLWRRHYDPDPSVPR